MQKLGKMYGNAVADALPRKERRNRSTRPWQEVVSE